MKGVQIKIVNLKILVIKLTNNSNNTHPAFIFLSVFLLSSLNTKNGLD